MWKLNSGYAFVRYGIDVPLVNPYICECVRRHRVNSEAPARRRAAQPRGDPEGRPRRLLGPRPRGSPRGGGAPRQGRHGHRLPPLPDQGGAARGAGARAVRRSSRAGRARRSTSPIPGPRSRRCCGAAPSCRPRSRADGGGRRLQAERRRGRPSELHACTERRCSRAPRQRARCAPTPIGDDIRLMMCGARQRDADGRRRLASLPDRHARRHAG